MATQSQNLLLKCTLCGTGITQSGSMITGNISCDNHDFKPWPVCSSRRLLPIPSSELKWLRIIDQNKQKNETHCNKFQADLKVLNQLETTARDDITSMVNKLKAKLDERHQELQHKLSESFQSRHQKICNNLNILTQHKNENREAKDYAEDLLIDSKQVADREKRIVESCQNIIRTTPKLKYIDTELHFAFDSMHRIEKYISEFGTLHTNPIDCGAKCVFKSTSELPVTRPQSVECPIIQLKNTTYDDDRNRIKLTFKILTKTQEIDNFVGEFEDCLKIHVLCAESNDDIDDPFISHIHEEFVPLNQTEKMSFNKNSLYVSKRFEAEMLIETKLRMVFESPDLSRYKDAESGWSRVQSYDVPEPSIPNQLSIIVIYANCKKRIVMKNKPQKNMDCHYTMEYLRKIIVRKFKRKHAFGEYFDLRAGGGELIQMDEDIVPICSFYERNDFEIIPYDEVLLFGFIRGAECENVCGDIIRMIFHWFSGHPIFRTLGDNWNCWRHKQENNKAANISVVNKDILHNNNLNGTLSKKKMRIVATTKFGVIKKRVVLKKNPDTEVNEFTMDALKRKLIQRYAKRGLCIPFTLTTENGNVIQSDEDILHLAGFDGVINIEVTQ